MKNKIYRYIMSYKDKITAESESEIFSDLAKKYHAKVSYAHDKLDVIYDFKDAHESRMFAVTTKDSECKSRDCREIKLRKLEKSLI